MRHRADRQLHYYWFVNAPRNDEGAGMIGDSANQSQASWDKMDAALEGLRAALRANF
jgi:hypothetical protein